MALNPDIHTQMQAFQGLRDKAIAAKALLDELILSVDDLASHNALAKYLDVKVFDLESYCNVRYSRVASLGTALDAFLAE